MQVKAKIEHPELRALSDYHYDELCSIEGELHIIGMSPNNCLLYTSPSPRD